LRDGMRPWLCARGILEGGGGILEGRFEASRSGGAQDGRDRAVSLRAGMRPAGPGGFKTVGAGAGALRDGARPWLRTRGILEGGGG